MRALSIGTAEVDVTENLPFAPNHKVVGINLGAGTAVLRSAPTSGGTTSNIKSFAANEVAEVEIDNPFLDTDTGTIVLLTN
tara:strand:+ start:13184 stop:13426 length:243 start_codon:yes stop_codon:yes gene_type:complete